MMALIVFTTISVLYIFGQPLPSNVAAEAFPTVKNACQQNIVAGLRTSFRYTVFINAYICVGKYPNKKQNWTNARWPRFFSSDNTEKV